MSDSTIYPGGTVDSVRENMSDSTIYPGGTVDSVGENMSDSTIYPGGTVDSVGENMSDSTIYPAGAVDTVGENMSDCKIYPADTIDIYGNVWPTVGENIRNGMFGENIKAGYVYIDKGNVSSTDFIIDDVQTNSFRISNANSYFALATKIVSGGFNFTIVNFRNSCRIFNGTAFNDVSGTVKITYKELL